MIKISYTEQLTFFGEKCNTMRQITNPTHGVSSRLLRKTNKVLYNAEVNVCVKIESIINYDADIIKCIDDIKTECVLQNFVTFLKNSNCP